MFSHASNSCTTPCCLSCGSKDHPTEEHPLDAPLWCVNYKGNHNSSYKECNTCRVRMGLKPVPHKNTDTPKKSQNNSDKDCSPGSNQRRKEKRKDREIPQERDPITKNISLSNTDITTLLANNPSWIEQQEHTAKLIHNQAKDRLMIKILAHGKPNNTPTTKSRSEMEVNKLTTAPQWIHNLTRNQLSECAA